MLVIGFFIKREIVMRYCRIYLFIGLFTFLSCSETENRNVFFQEKDAQPVSEHRIEELTLVDSLNLTRAFDSLSVSTVKHTNGTLVFRSSQAGYRFHLLDAESLEITGEISIPEGRGPGEILRMAGYDVKDGILAILDSGNLKTVLYNMEGEYLNEFVVDGVRPNDIEMIDSETFIYSALRNPDGMFHVIKSNETTLHSFQQQKPDANLNIFSGEMVYKDGVFYFGGYAEPIIRGYEIGSDGVEPIFSKAIIDDYDTENNYEERGGDFRVFAFSEQAQYASHDLDVSGDYLYLARHTNGDPEYRYLDAYNIRDGSYEVSFPMHYYPWSVTSDENYIYVLEGKPGEEEGEVSERYLMKYVKPEMDF